MTNDFNINAELVFFSKNGLTFLMGAAGGDWEHPVAFILYIDHNGNVRGYVPKDGNAYNHKFKTAYGSEDSGKGFDIDELEEEDAPPFDNEKMINDICNRIIVVD